MMKLCKIFLAVFLLAGCASGAENAAAGPGAVEAASVAAVIEPPLEIPGAEPAAPQASETLEPSAQKPAGPVFHIQLWDAHKTGWDERRLAAVAAAGFTVVQHGWNGSLFPTRSLVDRVASHGLLYGVYIDTRYLFRRYATSLEKVKTQYVTGPDGSRGREPNPLDGVYQAVVRREMWRGLRDLDGSEGLYKIMLNSEHNSPLSYDELTVEEAVRAGAMKPGERIPYYVRGVYKPVAAEDGRPVAEPVRFLRWFNGDAAIPVINRVAGDEARRLRPGLRITTDPLMDHFTYGQYRGMEILQDWVRIHRAPRDPLSMAYRTERLKANLRHSGAGEIWIGPQLGSGSGENRYGAPADAFEETLWLAVAFGARGITCWGYNTLRAESALDLDTWSRVGKFRTRLLSQLPWLLEATDAPRDCAVLLSKANQVLSGRVYYEVEENYMHFYRVLLTAHVPTDVLYDDDVLEGALSRYKVLFLPGIEELSTDLEEAIAGFEESGGRIVRWHFLSPRYRDYEITKGNYREDIDVERTEGKHLLPHQYRKWRHIQAERLFKTVEDIVTVRVDNPDVIVNVVDAGGKRYILLINDSRTYGAWTLERRHRWGEDKGKAATATVTVPGPDGPRSVSVTIPPGSMVSLPHHLPDSATTQGCRVWNSLLLLALRSDIDVVE